MNLRKHIQPGEKINIAQLYKRIYNETGNYYSWDTFYQLHVRDTHQIIVHEWEKPITVERKPNFLDKWRNTQIEYYPDIDRWFKKEEK